MQEGQFHFLGTEPQCSPVTQDEQLARFLTETSDGLSSWVTDITDFIYPAVQECSFQHSSTHCKASGQYWLCCLYVLWYSMALVGFTGRLWAWRYQWRVAALLAYTHTEVWHEPEWSLCLSFLQAFTSQWFRTLNRAIGLFRNNECIYDMNCTLCRSWRRQPANKMKMSLFIMFICNWWK